MAQEKKAENIRHEHAEESDFVPGVYRHWKGGLYHALSLGWANESLWKNDFGQYVGGRERVVIYISMTTGEFNTRQYNSDRKDAWTDWVFYDNVWTQRFRYVGYQPVP